MSASLQVEGARQLRRTLKEAGDDLSDLKDVYGAVATLVAWRGQATAPRRSGKLSQSVRGNRAASKSVIMAGTAKIRYAPAIHWGWPRRHISANPWLSQAAQSTEGQWTELYAQGVQEVLDGVVGA